MIANKFDEEMFIAYILAKKGKRSYEKISKEIGFGDRHVVSRITTRKHKTPHLNTLIMICDWLQIPVRTFFNN